MSGAKTKNAKTTDKVVKTEAEWRKELTPMQYAVLREKATERPFSGEYEYETRPGTYVCAGCGQTLFESDAKTTPRVEKSEAEWRKELTPMQYAVLREKATERPFTGEYEHDHRAGTYVCAGCGQTLFESDAKF
ncbi:MAG TPA: peptide-methionine (R)-S-oxide reductase, partial [Bradyrhizobium sp.]|uniref:peptide-methionine (R)-S-oxide reductase n=1 Tax=Bradyrhizobium sp. TaxID=376 RepID=UPI002BB10497